MWVVYLLAFLAVLSFALALWQWFGAWGFPLHQPTPGVAAAPTPDQPASILNVTLLKPLKGWEPATATCLRSWLDQKSPGAVQILFGVASPADPSVAGVRQLLLDYPLADAELIICPESLGANAKVSTLIQLRRRARHEVVLVSDADVLAPPTFLVHALAPLQDPNVGLVNAFYCLANPSTLAMHWEAVAINGDFWSQVLQGRSLAPLDFALGAVMVTRQHQLEKIGGFERFVDHLADDFQLGNRIARAGWQIALIPLVVECWSPPMSWREVWNHQLRWARTIRVSKPLPYALSVVSNATLWPLLWLWAQPQAAVLGAVGGLLLARTVMAHSLQNRLRPGTARRRLSWLVPVKDLFQIALWLLAFIGNHITWRGRRFRLARDGRLIATGEQSAPLWRPITERTS